MTRTSSKADVRLDVTRAGRAEASEGERTTLRVPPDLGAAADRLAAEDGVSRNAALIALARRGRDALAADGELEAIRERIGQLTLATPLGAGGPDFPSPEEYAQAVLEPRGEEPPSR